MDATHGQPTNHFRDEGALWPAQPVQLARGRQPRDALAKTVPYSVSSMDDFETSLREYLNSPPEQPEHTEAQLSFWIGTSFMVSAPSSLSMSTSMSASALNARPPQAQHPQEPSPSPSAQPHLVQQHVHAPPGYQPVNGLQAQYGRPAHAYPSLSDPAMALTADASDAGTQNDGGRRAENKVSLSIMEALQPTSDPKEKMRKQRAIAKCCVDSIQRIDGYRYSFHNCWNSREDDSFRFSYYCNDSLLNKDRAANGKGAKLGKRATKPVYDCKGVLSIKFSATKNTLDVFYKHVPVHKTYEERAPPPRKDSKRRKILEDTDPDALARIASRPRQMTTESEDRDAAASSKKKQKPARPEPPKPSNTSLESDLRAQSLRSLLELIQVDPPGPAEPTPPEPPPPPPPPPPLPQQSGVVDQSALHIQTQPVQQRRRPRNSCDVCKAKKTKCNGSRPVCQTCTDKNRQCYYSDAGAQITNEQLQPISTTTAVQHAPSVSASNGLSELEKMKKELEEAKARIQELESEQRSSTTPVQTPQMMPRPQSQPKLQAQQTPQVRHRPTPSLGQVQTQPQRSSSTSQHRQQLQQLNQGHQRGLGSPPQTVYNMGTQSPQQIQTPQRQSSNPQQQMQSAQQQLQAAAAQQMQASQHGQLQTQNFFSANHTNHTPYGTVNRPMPQNSVPTQPQPAGNPLQTSNTVLSPTAPSVDAGNPYNRNDFTWQPYYGYQNAQQQQQQQQQRPPPQQQQQQPQQPQQDQWAATRGSGVFR